MQIHDELSINYIRSLAYNLLLYYLSRARGSVVSIYVGRYCFKHKIRNPALVCTLHHIIETEYPVVQYNGSFFVLDGIEKKRGRARILRYRRINTNESLILCNKEKTANTATP
ncbi:MAG: hypothetical protein NZ954_08490 [Thermofilaceae archaeon]|nr:hypothetical protein [Thermofilaceae archaeon]MDW8005029.1 hypothetical protein [Thermofilaceae archaeon]